MIGTRRASTAGISRAQKLARLLVAQGVTVVSGLAREIDTAALEAGRRTIAVIGTPLSAVYSREDLPLPRSPRSIC